MYVCMYGTYSNSDKSISTLYKVNFMIHTAATSCPQVNNKTVQNVCIESNAHCIKESNYSDLESLILLYMQQFTRIISVD